MYLALKEFLRIESDDYNYEKKWLVIIAPVAAPVAAPISAPVAAPPQQSTTKSNYTQRWL